MQVAQQGFIGKTNRAITSAVRNTSCNRGWLQVFTHIVCGTFTVTSFVLILLIALQIFPKRSSMVAGLRCYVTSCRVICHEAPYYEQYEDDVLLAVMEADNHCQRVFITLTQPAFTNETMPQNWLARMRSNVYELSIIGGNLRHISQNAFSSSYARHIKLLLLENVTISSWTQNMLLGLASLQSIFIKSCNILYVQHHALMAVSQTLEALTVMDSGHWDPSTLTGSGRLTSLLTVDYSSNVFGSILGNTSFSRLRFCKSLYLSSSRITYIGPGAFDNLRNIEYLNLDNNFLKTVEPRLFHAITSSNNPSVRINLVNNLWHCDCGVWDLRRLIQKGVLLADPTCHTPSNLRGKTFTEFNDYCNSRRPRRIVVLDMSPKIKEEQIDPKLHSFDCDGEETPFKLSPVLVSPFQNYECAATIINTTFFHNPTVVVDFYDNLGYFWIKPTIVIRGINFTMIELGSSGLEGYGLIWYRSSCPNEIFCVNVIPEIIRLYNMNLSNQYTFCPVIIPSGSVKSEQCIAYSTSTTIVQKVRAVSQIMMYVLIAVSFLFFGALCLYMLIRKYPALLKGSKRLLFVKHKTVDALVLPPKVPLRSSMLSNETSTDFNGNSGPLQSDFLISQLARSVSIRSTNSCAPSYISALQPTEEQLSDWRLKHFNGKFENDHAAITTISSDVTPISILSGSDNLYFSLDENSQSKSISFGNSSNLDSANKSIGPV